MYEKNPQAITQLVIDGIKAKIQAAITEVETVNNPSVALTKEERKEGVTVGKQREPFTDFYYGNKDNYPTLKPSQTVVPETDAVKHYFIHSHLGESLNLARKLVEMLEDMQLNAEHFSYMYASKGRLAAKTGKEAGLPGADTFFDALNALFPKTGVDADAPNP